jgi:putative SOS response-associated peptidase YedK
MCGRYVSVRSDDDVLAEFDAIHAADEPYPGDYNIAPTDPVRAIVNRPVRGADGHPEPDPTRQLRVLSWGLVPSWAKDRKGAARLINARVEGLATRPAFRSAYAQRRCLIPADGWYEWAVREGVDGARKQPVYLTPSDGHVLAFAGLYEFWGRPGETITTCTIITTAAQGALALVHDRMPLLLPRAAWTRWLDPAVDDPAELLTPWDEAAGERLEVRPVSTAVNSVRHDGPELIEPVADVEGVDVVAAQRLF